MADDIRAVIFDFGNVLSLPQDPTAVSKLAERLSLPVPEFVHLYAIHRAAYDEGTVGDEEYWRNVCAAAGRTCSSELIDTLRDTDHASWAHINPAMIDWARRIRRSGRSIAILSNMPISFYERVLRKYDWIGEFEQLVISGLLHQLKPRPEIYRSALSMLGVRPTEVLFFDDLEPNIHGAREAGIHAVHFTGIEVLDRALLDRFALPAFAG